MPFRHSRRTCAWNALVASHREAVTTLDRPIVAQCVSAPKVRAVPAEVTEFVRRAVVLAPSELRRSRRSGLPEGPSLRLCAAEPGAGCLSISPMREFCRTVRFACAGAISSFPDLVGFCLHCGWWSAMRLRGGDFESTSRLGSGGTGAHGGVSGRERAEASAAFAPAHAASPAVSRPDVGSQRRSVAWGS